jgi:hypothetical protein
VAPTTGLAGLQKFQSYGAESSKWPKDEIAARDAACKMEDQKRSASREK